MWTRYEADGSCSARVHRAAQAEEPEWLRSAGMLLQAQQDGSWREPSPALTEGKKAGRAEKLQQKAAIHVQRAFRVRREARGRAIICKLAEAAGSARAGQRPVEPTKHIRAPYRPRPSYEFVAALASAVRTVKVHYAWVAWQVAKQAEAARETGREGREDKPLRSCRQQEAVSRLQSSAKSCMQINCEVEPRSCASEGEERESAVMVGGLARIERDSAERSSFVWKRRGMGESLLECKSRGEEECEDEWHEAQEASGDEGWGAGSEVEVEGKGVACSWWLWRQEAKWDEPSGQGDQVSICLDTGERSGEQKGTRWQVARAHVRLHRELRAIRDRWRGST